jgi:hypothetical protein
MFHKYNWKYIHTCEKVKVTMQNLNIGLLFLFASDQTSVIRICVCKKRERAQCERFFYRVENEK